MQAGGNIFQRIHEYKYGSATTNTTLLQVTFFVDDDLALIRSIRLVWRRQIGGMKTLAHLAFGNDVNRIEASMVTISRETPSLSVTDSSTVGTQSSLFRGPRRH